MKTITDISKSKLIELIERLSEEDQNKNIISNFLSSEFSKLNLILRK